MTRILACSIALFAVSSLSFACVSAETDEADDPLLVRCSDPRSPICTREYMPVCGLRSDGSVSTYGNGCEACADERVVGYRPGECAPAG
jgi:hypothetical protein